MFALLILVLWALVGLRALSRRRRIWRTSGRVLDKFTAPEAADAAGAVRAAVADAGRDVAALGPAVAGGVMVAAAWRCSLSSPAWTRR
ncbi:hypothetical protein ACRAWD_09805 [Caulobacter segnis]